MKQMRFTTLTTKFGPVQHANKMSEADWQRAVAERRFATVYHGEGDWCTPLVAVVAHDGRANVICKIAWAKPLPADVATIIGLRNSDEAFALCNPQ